MKEQTLEQIFDKLDTIVESLEMEDVSLEASFQLYHEGMELLKTCNDKIEQIEKKMAVLEENGEQHEF